MSRTKGIIRVAEPVRTIHPILAELRRARQTRGIGQVELARETGYGVRQLTYMECGTHKPIFQTVCDLATALGYDIVLVPRQ